MSTPSPRSGSGRILQNDRAAMKEAMLGWSRDDDMWKRRSAILCQIRAKAETDLDLLYACIEPSLDSTEFFLRKAIGWALREYAWTDPAEVRRYVAANEARLSGLSKREALKNIGRAPDGRHPRLAPAAACRACSSIRRSPRG